MLGERGEVRGAGTWRATLPVWWRVARPFSLTASAIPVLVGGALALQTGRFDGLNFALLLVPSLLIQVATNAFNEYYDYRRGLDTHESVGIAGVIVGGVVSDRAVLRFALGCLLVALPFCLVLVARTGWPVLAAGLLSVLGAWIYSGGPKPVAYTPFGELEVFIFMGLIQVALGYIVHTGTLEPPVLWAALPVACLVAAILLANNLRDQVGDAARGRRTLPIAIGRGPALGVLLGLILGAYATLTVGVALGMFAWPALLPWLTLPMARGCLRPFRETEAPRALDSAVKRTAQLHLRFGLALTVGLLLGLLTR